MGLIVMGQPLLELCDFLIAQWARNDPMGDASVNACVRHVPITVTSGEALGVVEIGEAPEDEIMMAPSQSPGRLRARRERGLLPHFHRRRLGALGWLVLADRLSLDDAPDRAIPARNP